jgi:hypothetical protein
MKRRIGVSAWVTLTTEMTRGAIMECAPPATKGNDAGHTCHHGYSSRA